MCLATKGQTSRLDANPRTPGAQIGAFLSATQQPRKLPADPDLRDAYKRATRVNVAGRGLASTQMEAARDIMTEQKRRDDLRAENAKLTQARTTELARIAEEQKQAFARQDAEMQRQADLRQQVETERVAQADLISKQRTATGAVAQSLRILQAPGAAAPTAKLTTKRRGSAGVQRKPGSSLRIGSTQSGVGSGANLPG